MRGCKGRALVRLCFAGGCAPAGWGRGPGWYPSSGWLGSRLGAQRPGGPACPAGVPISPEKWGERGPGPLVIDRWFRQNHCRVDPATWVPRRLRRGSPTFFEESRGKEHQGQAPGPRILWPLVPTRWILGSLSLVRSRGYFLRYAKTDLGRIFEGKYTGKHFPERKFPNQGTYMGPVIAHRPEQCGTPRQNERVATSGP